MLLPPKRSPVPCVRIDGVKGLRGGLLNLEASGGLFEEVRTSFGNVTDCFRGVVALPRLENNPVRITA